MDTAASAIADYVNDNPVIEVDDNGVPVCPPAVYYYYDNYYISTNFVYPYFKKCIFCLDR